MNTENPRTPPYTSAEVYARVPASGPHSCGVCLDFGYLPDVGPCPRCRTEEYAEYILAWARDVAEAEAASGDAA